MARPKLETITSGQSSAGEKNLSGEPAPGLKHWFKPWRIPWKNLLEPATARPIRLRLLDCGFYERNRGGGVPIKWEYCSDTRSTVVSSLAALEREVLVPFPVAVPFSGVVPLGVLALVLATFCGGLSNEVFFQEKVVCLLPRLDSSAKETRS